MTPCVKLSAVFSIGVDIGGTKLAAGVVDPAGRVVERVERLSPVESARDAEEAIVDVVGDLGTRHAVGAVGLGVAGWVDTDQTTIRFSPHLAWRDEPLARRLRERLPLPVSVDNDANAAAWAEYVYGAGRGSHVMVLIAVGTGIGGALVIDGRVFRGAWGLAGEWGHATVVPQGRDCACGNRGCWEQYVSGEALVRETARIVEIGGPKAAALTRATAAEGLSGPLVTRLAFGGDRVSAGLIAEVGSWLGRGLANLAAGLDPDVFVIGGGVCEAGDLLLEPARAAFAQSLTGRGFRPVADIRRAELGNDAGIVGAADLARRLAAGA